MRLDEYVRMDATELAALVRAREVTPSELRRLATEMHVLTHPDINAVVELSLIHISEPTRLWSGSRMPSSA